MMTNRGSFLSKVVESLQYRSSIADNSKIPSISNERGNVTFECTSNKQSKNVNIVGRDDQLNELHQIFDRLKISEKIEIVLIHGAPGSGKSSLVEAFTQNLP
jgi:predicted AAA+ superfamily ATPase